MDEVKGTTFSSGTVTYNAPSTHDDPCGPDVPTAKTERVTKIERTSDDTFVTTTVRTSLDFQTTSHLVNGVVIPNLTVLLANVLGAVDAAIPNKDQNKAVKHIVRTAFDGAYMDILQRAYPDSAFGHTGGYALEPQPDRSKAFDQGMLKTIP